LPNHTIFKPLGLSKTASEILFATAEGINTCFNAVFGPRVGQKPHIKETANAFGRDISVWGEVVPKVDFGQPLAASGSKFMCRRQKI
jgi:hypothetical protein